MGNTHTNDATVNSSSDPMRSLKAYSVQQNRAPNTSLKIKPLISLKTHWKCLQSSDLAYLKKYKSKMLSEINLSHNDAEEMKGNGLRKLRKAIMDTKIPCPITIDIEGPNTKHLGYLLTPTNNWKKLMLCSTAYERVLNQDSVNILQRIKGYKNLTHLNIFLGYWEKEEETTLIAKCLQKSTRCLIKLTNLDINSSAGTTKIHQGSFHGTIANNAPLLAIKYPASLSSLSLNLKVITAINQQLLSQFISNLQPIDKLEYLNLGSEFISTGLLPSETQIWERFFQKTKNLKALSLTKHIFEETQQIQEGTQAFLDGFHHLKNLRVLNIDFLIYAGYRADPCQTFTSTLYSHLTSFPHLKTLALSFTQMTGSRHSDIPDVIPPLQQLTQLEKFCLRFDNLRAVNDALLQKITQSIQYLINLKDLQLHFANEEISYETITSLSQSLQKLTQLQILHLYFPNAIQNYHSIEILSKSIVHLNLISLGLILSRPMNRKTTLQKIGSLWEDPKRLTHFFSAIYGFNLLTNLSLDLSIFDVSIPECKHFALALRELQQLNSLSLVLPEFDSFHNFETLQYVLGSIKEMSKLRFLSLSFKQPGLRDREIKHLTTYLSQCRSVQFLGLRFADTEKLSEGVLRELLLSLRNLPLKSLKIYFNRFFEFQKELTLLKNLKNLDLLQFDMYYASSDFRDPLFSDI